MQGGPIAKNEIVEVSGAVRLGIVLGPGVTPPVIKVVVKAMSHTTLPTGTNQLGTDQLSTDQPGTKEASHEGD